MIILNNSDPKIPTLMALNALNSHWGVFWDAVAFSILQALAPRGSPCDLKKKKILLFHFPPNPNPPLPGETASNVVPKLKCAGVFWAALSLWGMKGKEAKHSEFQLNSSSSFTPALLEEPAGCTISPAVPKGHKATALCTKIPAQKGKPLLQTLWREFQTAQTF